MVNTIPEVAAFLMRSEEEVRAKMAELIYGNGRHSKSPDRRSAPATLADKTIAGSAACLDRAHLRGKMWLVFA